MPLTKKQQVLAKIETNEGFSAGPVASDAVQVFDPTLSDDVDVQERSAAGPTLSSDLAPVGRQTREVAFRTDFRGSGSTITAPDFARFLQACGYRLSALQIIDCDTPFTGTGFQIGEEIYVGASYAAATKKGVLVGMLSGSNAPLHRSVDDTSRLIVATVLGAFANPDQIVGNSSATTCPIASASDHAGFCYQPTSQKLVRLQTAAWSAGTIAAGDTLKLENATSGILLGAVQVVNLTSQTDFEVVVLFLQNGGFHATPAQNRLRSPANNTTTLSTAQIATRTPSLTIRHNADGWQSDMLGARGDFTLEGDGALPLQFAWTFRGDPVAGVSAAQIATTGLSTVSAPRLLGSFCCYGLGAEVHRLPTKRVSVANGGTVNPNLDANRDGGSTGSNIVERTPQITITVDRVNGGFDWEAARRNSTLVRAAFLLGTVVGNIVAVTAPKCQVVGIANSDSDGVGTLDVTLAVRRIQESGDDEIYFAQL